MVDDKDEGEEFFQAEATTEGSLTVAVADSGDHKSRAESDEDSANLSDVKYTFNKLFPRFSVSALDKVAKTAAVARIATDVFLDQMYLTVTDTVQMWDESIDGELDVQEVINLCYWLLSIGIDGKGRVDIIQVSANAIESKDSSSLGSALGV
jgi:hypothetical protein